jgi:glucose/arabinose dehydrogenase
VYRAALKLAAPLWSRLLCGRNRVVLFWAPSINPGNLSFYTGDKLTSWRGDLLLATMARSLMRISFDAAGEPTGQERLLTELGQRLRDVRQGPDGFVYVLTDETAGALLKIEPCVPVWRMLWSSEQQR